MNALDPVLAKELDRLTTQVNPDNILAVHRVFREGADDLMVRLTEIGQDTHVGLCGLDPVSKDAAAAFNSKIAQLLSTHLAHQEELNVAANHLRSIALRYGNTEEEIERSLGRNLP